MKYSIESDLLFEYILTIKNQQQLRESNQTSAYAVMENFRTNLHEKILKQAGVTRSDKEFRFWLAGVVEGILEMCPQRKKEAT